jgi:ribosomal protein S18 acetylase RimI-like enzyme
VRLKFERPPPPYRSTSMSYTIRPLTCLDSRSTKDIFIETFHRDDWSEFGWIWRWRSKTESVGVFNTSGDLLGFALILGHCRELKYIAVHPLFQKHKLGSLLLNHVLKTCIATGKSLHLVPANKEVEAWYTRHGFYTTKYFTTSDNTNWKVMHFHSKNTRSQSKFL